MYHTVFYIAKTFGYFWTVLYLIIATRAVAATPTYEGVEREDHKDTNSQKHFEC